MNINPIIDELNAVARMDWPADQKAYYEQRAKDARAVECVPMRDVFTADQMRFIRTHYKAKQKECYKNAADLVLLITHNDYMFGERPLYVEGFAFSYGILPIEHAFVKIGDKYIDPTFERALHLDVRNEHYASLIELGPGTMCEMQAETGYYGDLYQYAYTKAHRPDLAAKIRALNPDNR